MPPQALHPPLSRSQRRRGRASDRRARPPPRAHASSRRGGRRCALRRARAASTTGSRRPPPSRVPARARRTGCPPRSRAPSAASAAAARGRGAAGRWRARPPGRAVRVGARRSRGTPAPARTEARRAPPRAARAGSRRAPPAGGRRRGERVWTRGRATGDRRRRRRTGPRLRKHTQHAEEAQRHRALVDGRSGRRLEQERGAQRLRLGRRQLLERVVRRREEVADAGVGELRLRLERAGSEQRAPSASARSAPARHSVVLPMPASPAMSSVRGHVSPSRKPAIAASSASRPTIACVMCRLSRTLCCDDASVGYTIFHAGRARLAAATRGRSAPRRRRSPTR